MYRWRRLGAGRIIFLAALLVAIAAFLSRDQWSWILQGDELVTGNVEVTSAVALNVDAETERLYRIVPDGGSQASYEITENLGGVIRTTVGATTVMAGQIVLNTEDIARSRIGEIIVNVETLVSDSTLRDKRIRHEYLESSRWPFVSFVPTSFGGVDGRFVEGAAYDVAVTGFLTVKETTLTETFTGTVMATEHLLTADMTTSVLSSDYEVGPINIARLAQTSDEVVLRLKLVADRSETSSGSDAELARDGWDNEVPAGRFAETVQPILENKCVSCHMSGGPGWGTLALDTAADAAVIAADIAFVTRIGYMPPWLPSDLSPAFAHDRSLSDEELAAVAAWAETGGGLDVAPETPLVARALAVLPIEPDQVISPRDGPYTGHSGPDGEPLKEDDYRCQVYEVADPEGDGNWVKGFEFRPDQTSVVHHAIVYRVPVTAADEIATRIAEEDGNEIAAGLSDEPGWTCFGLAGLRSRGVSSIQGWAPGQQPTIYPDGYGLHLEPGDMVVTQIHYHYDHDTPPDSSLIILDIATAEESARMVPMAGASYLTPAEVPCTPEEAELAARRASEIEGYVNLCLRSNVLDEVGEKYSVLARMIPDLLLRQCGGTVDDYDDLEGTVGHSSCDLPAQHSGIIHTVFAHMHEFGKSYRMTLRPDTPEETILLDIPTWDFEWQLNYDPVADIRIEAGDKVRFECWWDRTLQPMAEPRYITWNEGTVDEMCFSSISVAPDPPPDR